MTQPLHKPARRRLPAALVAASLALGWASLSAGPSSAQDGCSYFELSSILVNVRRDPSRPGGYLDVLEKGDLACVTEQRKIEDTAWAFVRKKTTETGDVSDVGGWANMRYLTPASAPASEPAPVRPTPAPEVRIEPIKPRDSNTTSAAASPSTTAPPPPASTPTSTPASTPVAPRRQTASAAPVTGSDTLRFDEPVPFGAYPVRGRTLEELAAGEPLFSPIEGLEEELWKKPCATCHKWNKERLCEQGSSYIKAAKYVLRHQHPYGGPYKLALMRWAKSGCN
jgi:hypothetical protein